MKVIAYSVKPFEKKYLAKANQKKHNITLVFNSLSLETAIFAAGKQAVIVSSTDDVSTEVINKLAELGVKYITTGSTNTANIDQVAASIHGIKLANTPNEQDRASQTIRNLDMWEMNKMCG
ncbi:lactate dehydrogenase [Mucilaginibacter sp.]